MYSGESYDDYSDDMYSHKYIPPHKRFMGDTVDPYYSSLAYMKKVWEIKREVPDETYYITPLIHLVIKDEALLVNVEPHLFYKRPTWKFNMNEQSYISGEPNEGYKYVWIFNTLTLIVWVHNTSSLDFSDICRIEFIRGVKHKIVYKDDCVEQYELAKLKEQLKKINDETEAKRCEIKEVETPKPKLMLPAFYRWIPPGVARQLFPLFEPGTVEDRSIRNSHGFIRNVRYAEPA